MINTLLDYIIVVMTYVLILFVFCLSLKYRWERDIYEAEAEGWRAEIQALDRTIGKKVDRAYICRKKTKSEQ